MKRMFALLACLATCAMLQAQASWDLKKDEDGIKVYTGSVPNTNVKAVKVSLLMDATPAQLASVLTDMRVHDAWVYSAKNGRLIKQVAPNDIVYYSEVSMPWPLTNRDVTAELNISQDDITKVMYVNVNAVAGYLPEYKDKIRVPMVKISWVVTPVGSNKISIEYQARVDPGGSVPAWLVNSFSTKGPLETFRQLRKLIATPAYHH